MRSEPEGWPIIFRFSKRIGQAEELTDGNVAKMLRKHELSVTPTRVSGRFGRHCRTDEIGRGMRGKKKGPVGERRGNPRAPIHAEPGRTQSCMSSPQGECIALRNEVWKIREIELLENYLLVILTPEVLDDFGTLGLVLPRAGITLVVQSLQVLQTSVECARTGHRGGLAEAAYLVVRERPAGEIGLDVLTDRLQQSALSSSSSASSFPDITKSSGTGSESPGTTETRKCRCTP